MSTAKISPGTVLDGQYTLGQFVRERRGATTHEATASDGRAVHVTVYAPDCFASALILERSLRELRQLQGVASGGMVSVLAGGKLDNGRAYEVHEAVAGPSLEQRIEQGALDVRAAATIIAQIGEALLAAQQAGVIHRNLGPNVVFLTESGAKVAGFTVGEPHGDTSFGPLDTMAPEQVEGKVVDQRTLVYNLAALMHAMLTGKPLFEGDTAQRLAKHAAEDPPSEVHETLKPALSKDPRMRPMMLRQFLADLTALGGVEAPNTPASASQSGSAASGGTASKPSTRGWTMFMNAEETGVEPAAPAPVSVAPAPVPSTPASSAAASGSEDGSATKPTTRGWTMFMTAEETGAGEDAAPVVASTPAPVPSAPEPKSATPSGPAAKPSTRGWTMFMTAEESGADEASDAKAPVPTPRPVAAVPSPAATPTPTGPTAEVKPSTTTDAPEGKPSTRGWTMFVEGGEGSPAASETAGEPAANKPGPEAEPVAPAGPTAPAAGPGTAKPSTRGWTMFVDGPPTTEAAAPPKGAATVPSESGKPVVPAGARPKIQSMRTPTGPAKAGAGGTKPAPSRAAAAAGPPGPSTRGWTMFMEPGKGKGREGTGDKPSGAAGPTAGAPPLNPSPLPANDDTPADELDRPVTRGWTMLMEAPLPKGGTSGPPSPPGSPAAGSRTVFAEGGGPGGPIPGASSGGVPQKPMGERPTGGRTVVAGSAPPMAAPASGPTAFASNRPASAADMPDTMYFKRGATEPRRPEPDPRRQTVEDVAIPAKAAVEKPQAALRSEGVPSMSASEHSGPLVPGRSAPVAHRGSGATMAWVAVAVVVVGAAVGAFFVLGT